MSDNIYVIHEKGYKIYNQKIHDLINIHFKEFRNLTLTLLETKDFIINNNTCDVKIIFYYHSAPNFGHDILKFIRSYDIKCQIYIFSFDWWIRTTEYWDDHRRYIVEIFKADKYKIITFADNIKQLNAFHNYDYTPYQSNIIFNNIWSSYNSSIMRFNNEPLNQVLLSGSLSRAYPERQKIKNINNVYYHVKTEAEINSNIDTYNQTLNKYLACFTSSVYVPHLSTGQLRNTNLILQKVFEILASGALLLYPLKEEEYIKSIGLINGQNCYLIDFSQNIQEQINKVLDPTHRKNIDNIRYNGYIHATTHLTSERKFKEIKEIIMS